MLIFYFSKVFRRIKTDEMKVDYYLKMVRWVVTFTNHVIARAGFLLRGALGTLEIFARYFLPNTEHQKIYLNAGSWHCAILRDGIGQHFLDPTGKFQNLRQLTSWSTGFSPKVFVHCSMSLMKNFQKGGMGEVLKFLTRNGGLRKFLWLNSKTFLG